MRGHIVQRSEGSWAIVIDIGRKLDPETGRPKRIQKWKTIRGTKKEAQAELATMLHNLSRGQVISSSHMTLSDWLEEWIISSLISAYEATKRTDPLLNVISNQP
ncbi:MAG: Arm DNA-binding domain-containing protein [Nitrospira sp.]|nr:Arm DNA-binding domain-containing protein [Nitrospira sp.]